MPKMTKALTAKLESLKSEVFAASDRVFSVSDRTDMPFLSCYALAPMETRAAHDMARGNLDAFERELISQGRGYRDAFGHFRAY